MYDKDATKILYWIPSIGLSTLGIGIYLYDKEFITRVLQLLYPILLYDVAPSAKMSVREATIYMRDKLNWKMWHHPAIKSNLLGWSIPRAGYYFTISELFKLRKGPCNLYSLMASYLTHGHVIEMASTEIIEHPEEEWGGMGHMSCIVKDTNGEWVIFEHSCNDYEIRGTTKEEVIKRCITPDWDCPCCERGHHYQLFREFGRDYYVEYPAFYTFKDNLFSHIPALRNAYYILITYGIALFASIGGGIIETIR